MSSLHYYSLRVREVIDDTADAKSIVFEIPPEHADAFRYKPGQFLTSAHRARRAPSAAMLLARELPARSTSRRASTVKRVAQGRVSNWICDRIKAGDAIEVKPPAGHFTPHSIDNENFLLFAGGSGITPIFSIINVRAHRGNGPPLPYICEPRRGLGHLPRATERHWNGNIRARLQVSSPATTRFTACPRLRGSRNSRDSWTGADCYVCGPEAFMDCALEALRGLGVAPSRIHVERFVSLPDEEDARSRRRAGSRTDKDSARSGTRRSASRAEPARAANPSSTRCCARG